MIFYSFPCLGPGLAAARAAGPDGLGQDDFGIKVRQKLGFIAANKNRRKEWMADPESIGVRQLDAERAIGQVLAHRVWADQRRGWRFTNPTLEELGLVQAIYPGIDEFVNDSELFENAPSILKTYRHKFAEKPFAASLITCVGVSQQPPNRCNKQSPNKYHRHLSSISVSLGACLSAKISGARLRLFSDPCRLDRGTTYSS